MNPKSTELKQVHTDSNPPTTTQIQTPKNNQKPKNKAAAQLSRALQTEMDEQKQHEKG